MSKFPVPDDNAWLLRRVEELEAKVQELQSARSGEAMSISGGGLTVKDGGAFRVRLPNNVVINYSGPLTFGGVSYQGLIMRRADGSAIFYTFPVAGDTDKIAWRWLDDEGAELVSSDAITGGLARPWIPLQGIPVLSSALPMTSNASYIAVWSTGWVVKQQPYIDLQALLRSESAATGNARFTINGQQVGSVMTIASNSFGWAADQKIALPGPFYAYVKIELEVQRTNASGTVGGVFQGTQRQT